MTLYDATQPYPRDLVGYGHDVPHAQWPQQARIAVQFVLNFEEGGENHVLHGDAGSEQFLSELFNPASYPDRHMSMDGIYEYGSRAGVWRLLRAFEQHNMPLTVFGVATALQRNPDMVKVFQDLGHEIACHGLKWIHYQQTPIEQERDDMRRAMAIMTELMGSRPVGWYTGRDSPNTHQLVADFGGFEYDSDYYGDDLPFWMRVQKTDGGTANQLIVPYTLDTNDMRFALPQGFSHGDPFFHYLKDSFDCLYAEGDPNGLNRPKMMSVGMHCRLLGRPGRFMAIKKFIEYVASHDHVWVATRQAIARHWRATHPYPA